ncbi:MAG: response regulator [Chromatiaceae bacterium]|nr:response regulator [Chromatiaceae bacterium]
MYRLLMVDDHALVRRGLRSILEEELPGITVEEAGDARAGLEALHRNLPDAVVLDIGLPDRSGLDLLKRIRQEWPALPVLILSMYDEEQYGLRVMRAGASGYLTKSSAPEHLVQPRAWPRTFAGRPARSPTAPCPTGSSRCCGSSPRATASQTSPASSA